MIIRLVLHKRPYIILNHHHQYDYYSLTKAHQVLNNEPSSCHPCNSLLLLYHNESLSFYIYSKNPSIKNNVESVMMKQQVVHMYMYISHCMCVGIPDYQI